MKRFVIFTFIVAFLAFGTSSAMAAAGPCVAKWGGIEDGCELVATPAKAGTFVLKGSKNVLAFYENGANGITYRIGTYHSSGNKTFGSTSGDQKTFSYPATARALVALPVSFDVGGEWAAAAWTAL